MASAANQQANPEIGSIVNAGGIATNYHEAGSGPPVILLHGSGPGVTAYANWRGVIPALSSRFRLFAPDILGFGYTARPAGSDYNLDRWVDHIVSFMDAIEVAKAHFVGNSFGGALTLAMAARYPERVDRMILMGSAGLQFEVSEGLNQVWAYQPSLDAMGELMSIFAYDTALVTPEIVESRYRASVRPGYQEAYSSMFPEPRQEKLNGLATPEVELAALPHRALVIHGREDRVVPLEVAIRLHRLLCKSQLHVFGECGHWTQVEKNKEFCALVGEFLVA